MSHNPPPSDASPDAAPPPILGSWPRMYALVLGTLVVVVLLLYGLSRVYS